MKSMKTRLGVSMTLAGLLLPTLLSAQQVMPLMSDVSPLSCYDLKESLRFGSQSAAVRFLQAFLLKEGYKIEPGAYGRFDASTGDALKAFQQKNKIVVTGKKVLLDGATRAKLNAHYGCGVYSQGGQNVTASIGVTNILLDGGGVTVTACNQGAEALPFVPVRVRLNGVNRDFDFVGAKAAGACTTSTFSYDTWGLAYDPGSTFTAVTIVDPNGFYKTKQLKFPLNGETTLKVPALPGVHLAVRSLLLKTTGVQATLCNAGSADVRSFPVRVTVNGVSKDVDVPGAYKAGQCVPVTWLYETWGFVYHPGDSFTATVIVDPNDIYKEINEFDNAATVIGTP
jgi:peptidoglycan hydrolase-like protein with peptidoglycan-binding domain